MLLRRLIPGLLLVPAILAAGVVAARSDSRGVLLRYEPGQLELKDDPVAGTRVRLGDGEHLAEPGEWDLPTRTVRVGIPQSGGVRLKVRTGPARTFEGVVVARVAVCARGSGSLRTGTAIDRTTAAVAELVSIEMFRDVRFAELRLNPVRYDPDRRLLRCYEWIEVEVEFEQSPVRVSQPDPLDGNLERLLLNGGQARAWKVRSSQDRAGFFDRSPYWVKVCVSRSGIHRITGVELEAAGVPLAGVDPTTLVLYTMGEHPPNGPYPDTMPAVGIVVEGEEDGRFDPDDRILFYGVGAEHWLGRCSAFVTNHYTDTSVYWLTWGSGRGRRAAVGLGPDTTGTVVLNQGRDKVRREEDSECPARSGLLWLWKLLVKGAQQDAVRFETELGLGCAVHLHRVSGRLLSETASNEVVVYFNYRPIDTLQFNAATPNMPFDFAVDTVLPAGSRRNRLSLELRGEGEKKVYVDYLEIEYTRRFSLADGQLYFLQDDTGTYRFSVRDVEDTPVVFDITDPNVPGMVVGFEQWDDSIRFCRRVVRPARFAIAGSSRLMKPDRMELRQPGRLAGEENQADYWVITPAEFVAPARKLARYRTGRISGIAYARADVAVLEDIYDNYAFGMQEPGAIKRFLADKRPAYGLLAGDATYDYKNNLGREKPPGVPSYEQGYGLASGAYDRTALAYDAWYADFEGDGRSPDMMLGRVTSRTAAEFRGFVDKVAGYENGPAGSWCKRYLLLADDEYEGYPGKPDPIGLGHVEQAEAMAVLPGNLMEPVKVYLTEYPFAGVKNKPAARAELMRQLRLGGLLLIFFGHGDAFDLTHESVLNISQVGEVENDYRSPFCFFGSCGVGRFEDTRYECISEELVRKTRGGAIATIGATKATTSGSNLVFARNLLIPLFRGPDSCPTIGSAFLAAWPTDRTYHLFGDPATKLRLPVASTQELAVRPDTLRPGARFTARSIVELPEGWLSWNLFGPRRTRKYISDRGTVLYGLPGVELARGNARLKDGRVFCQGVFPLGVPLDTVFVDNGYYAPVVRSCRLSGSAWNDSVDLSVVRDTITYAAEPVVTTDETGPCIRLLMDGRPMWEGMTVPASFELEGVVSDPSGIMIAPVPEANPRFFVNQHEDEVDLTDRLVFDDSLGTTARFKLSVRLEGEVDTLRVTVFDNLLNRTVADLTVRVLATDAVLAVDSVLVYPNPVKGEAYFTFSVNRPASVRVRVFSLSGRLVRDLGERPAVYGYNQVRWDGRDTNGNRPANGVYLLALTARTTGPGEARSVLVRDRFLIVR